jgi:prevent-host-death family protein
MIKVSATKFRNNMFDYLYQVEEGEIIVIERNNKEVARLVPTEQIDWRNKMTQKPELLVTPEELLEPMADIWKGHV